MIPYFLLLLLPILIGVHCQRYRICIGKKTIYQTSSMSIDVFMFILLVLLVFRGLQCGIDTKQYLNLYNKYSSYSISDLFLDYNHELGYKLLNKLIGLSVDDFQFLIGITSAICVFPLWYFYKRESEHPILTIVLFLSVAPFMMYFSGIRQAMAMAFGIPAWYAAKNKRIIWFIGIILGAMQFHTSAFILALLYPLYQVRITPKWLWGVIPCMVLVYIFKAPIFNFMLELLWKDYNTTSETNAIMVFLLLIIFGIYAYAIPDEKFLNNDCIALRNILLLSIVLQSFAQLHPLAMRMNYYFLIFVPILIPKIAMRSRKMFDEIAQLSVGVMIIFFSYYFMNTVITDNDPLNIIPYITFWNN